MPRGAWWCSNLSECSHRYLQSRGLTGNLSKEFPRGKEKHFTERIEPILKDALRFSWLESPHLPSSCNTDHNIKPAFLNKLIIVLITYQSQCPPYIAWSSAKYYFPVAYQYLPVIDFQKFAQEYSRSDIFFFMASPTKPVDFRKMHNFSALIRETHTHIHMQTNWGPVVIPFALLMIRSPREFFHF